MSWAVVSIVTGRGVQGAERTLCEGMGSWWRDKFIYRSKIVPVSAKCRELIAMFTALH